MERPNFHFRQGQSAFDLIRLLQLIDDTRLTRLGGERLKDIVRSSSCRFESQSDEGCYAAVASAALDSSVDAAIAIAVLVANDLQRGFWCGNVEEFAEIAIEKIQSAPVILRRAILRGLDALEGLAYRYAPRDPILPCESRLTQTIDQILPKLCDLARRMDKPTRKSVAAADYGQDIAMHLEALSDTLANADCQFPKGEFLHPKEVVELVSHVRSNPGFVSCTALLLANALPTNDRMGWFGFRWHNLAPDYNSLPNSARAPILAGLRYLYESGEDFMVFKGNKSGDPVLAPESMIHFAHLPGDIELKLISKTK